MVFKLIRNIISKVRYIRDCRDNYSMKIKFVDIASCPCSIEHIKQYSIPLIYCLLPTKIRISVGCWKPVTVLDLIELGVDVFDSSYSYIITEQSQALTFMCDDICESDQYRTLIAEKRYKDDFTPICKNCECLTCQNHTRAYLHHLHHTKEMLGLVLLMIHNTHHYLQFFTAIRDSIKNGTINNR